MAEQTDSKVPQIRFKGFEREWVEKELGELTPLRGGFAFLSSQYRDKGIPIVKISNVLSSGDVGGVFAFYNEQPNDQNYSLPNNAALLAMSGATTGKVSILKKSASEKIYQNQRVGYFEDLETADYQLISTLVRSNFFTDQLDSVLVAGAQPNVSSKEINSFDFMIPRDKAEQTQIGGYFKELDGMIGLHQRKHGKLVTLKQAMLQKMFPQNGTTTPEIRFKGFSEPWVERNLGENTANISNNTLSRADLNYSSGLARNVHYGDILIKFGEVIDVCEGNLPFISNDGVAAKLKSSGLQNGDIVIADAAEDQTVGKCSEVQNIGDEIVLAGLHTIALRPLISYAPFYLGYFLNSNTFHNQLLPLMQGTKVLSISKTVIKQTSISSPTDKEEQQKIGTYFRQLDTLITKHAIQLEKLKQLKSACLEKMFV